MAAQFEGQVNFYTMDVKTTDGLAVFKSLQLMGVPQSVFFLNGELKESLPGAISESIFKKEIRGLEPGSSLPTSRLSRNPTTEHLLLS